MRRLLYDPPAAERYPLGTPHDPRRVLLSPQVLAPLSVLAVLGCALPQRGEVSSLARGTVVVRAYWLSDSTRATPMIQVLAYAGTPTQRGALLLDQRVDTANWVTLAKLPIGPVALSVTSIGFYRQLIPVTVRSDCPDTVMVYMPSVQDEIIPETPRLGRWRLSSCRPGA